jgi:hypothetical protein
MVPSPSDLQWLCALQGRLVWRECGSNARLGRTRRRSDKCCVTVVHKVRLDGWCSHSHSHSHSHFTLTLHTHTSHSHSHLPYLRSRAAGQFSPPFSCRRLLVGPGYKCPLGTGALGVPNMCNTPDSYCPENSSVATPAAPGTFTIAALGGLYYAASMCSAGQYCVGGVAFQCPAGRFGNTSGSSNSNCTGICNAGYFCYAGSTSAKQQACYVDGSAYCPEVTLACKCFS